MTAVEAPAATTSGDLLEVIRWAENNRPRSLQKAIGPSSVGQPCSRRLMLGLLGATVHNTTADKWAATMGSAVHDWLAAAFTADNARRVSEGLPPRWLVEQRVTVRLGLSGSTDLYDLETHTVVDWKVLGHKSMTAKRAADDPGQQYRWQLMLYGRGWANLGMPVANVAAVCLPRSGILRDTWRWCRPYDPAVADEALARMDALLVGADISESAGQLEEFMRALDRDTTNCSWCPFYRPGPDGDPTDGCAGPFEDPDFKQPAKQAMTGIF